MPDSLFETQFAISSFKYVYQYKDHLGNVRLSYTDNNNDGVIQTAMNPGGGKAEIAIWLNTEKNTNNEYAKNYKNNPNDPKAKQLYILSRVGTIFHETIIHAISSSKDLTDDCKLNCSNNTSKKQHKEAKKAGSMFYDKGIPAMQKLHERQKSGITVDKVKSIMKNYKL